MRIWFIRVVNNQIVFILRFDNFILFLNKNILVKMSIWLVFIFQSFFDQSG